MLYLLPLQLLNQRKDLNQWKELSYFGCDVGRYNLLLLVLLLEEGNDLTQNVRENILRLMVRLHQRICCRSDLL